MPTSLKRDTGRTFLLLHNAFRQARRPIDVEVLRQLESTAAQDGRLDPGERDFLAQLPLPRALESELATYLRRVREEGVPPNPEVQAMRGLYANFDSVVRALERSTRPGDLVFWHGRERRFPWTVMTPIFGYWHHVSVVLGDGRLLDARWPEGAAIRTVEATVARNFARTPDSEILVSRLERPLSLALIRQLLPAAQAIEGSPYAMLAPADGTSRGSCAKMTWRLFLALGIDLGPPERRKYRTLITPGDLLRYPVALILPDGQVRRDPRLTAVAHAPHGPLALLSRGADLLSFLMPLLTSYFDRLGDDLARFGFLAMTRRTPVIAPQS